MSECNPQIGPAGNNYGQGNVTKIYHHHHWSFKIIGGEHNGKRIWFVNSDPLVECAIAGWVNGWVAIARRVLANDEIFIHCRDNDPHYEPKRC